MDKSLPCCQVQIEEKKRKLLLGPQQATVADGKNINQKSNK